jgi:hypothetical protein
MLLNHRPRQGPEARGSPAGLTGSRAPPGVPPGRTASASTANHPATSRTESRPAEEFGEERSEEFDCPFQMRRVFEAANPSRWREATKSRMAARQHSRSASRTCGARGIGIGGCRSRGEYGGARMTRHAAISSSPYRRSRFTSAVREGAVLRVVRSVFATECFRVETVGSQQRKGTRSSLMDADARLVNGAAGRNRALNLKPTVQAGPCREIP